MHNFYHIYRDSGTTPLLCLCVCAWVRARERTCVCELCKLMFCLSFYYARLCLSLWGRFSGTHSLVWYISLSVPSEWVFAVNVLFPRAITLFDTCICDLMSLFIFVHLTFTIHFSFSLLIDLMVWCKYCVYTHRTSIFTWYLWVSFFSKHSNFKDARNG